MRRRTALLLAIVAAAPLTGCGGDATTALRVTVHFDAALAIDQLRVTVAVEGEATAGPPQLVPPTPRVLDSGQTLVLLLPDSWSSTLVTARVDGLAAGAVVAVGQGSALTARGKTVAAVVTLCTDACAPGVRECVGDGLRTCVQLGACTRWDSPLPCPADIPYCSNGACAATCGQECSEGQRRCVGVGYQACGQHDSDPCRDWGPIVACAAGEACRERDAQCVLWCDDGPCPCTTGATQACADRGECRGGVRRCVDGELGPCEWAVGPTDETCDGQDNDCNGVVDDGLAAPACPLQAGVCTGAMKTCGGAAGWLACGVTEYQVAAALVGGWYEVSETRCDGQDNDCDGAVDEAAGCCSSSCAGKACGADDGCGFACLTGTCPANATCQSGVCRCQYADCSGACCAVGQVCAGGACCTPDCSGRECGPDPFCGQPCGTCGGTGDDCTQPPTCSDGRCAGAPLADGTTCGSEPMMYCLGGACQPAQLACQDREPGGYTLYSAVPIYGTGTVYPCPSSGAGTGSCTCDGLTFAVDGSGYECVSTTKVCAACVSVGMWRYCW